MKTVLFVVALALSWLAGLAIADYRLAGSEEAQWQSGMTFGQEFQPQVFFGIPGQSERDSRAPLIGEGLELWHSLIVEIAGGRKGTMFKHPPVTYLAVGASLEAEGTHYVFAMHPDPNQTGKARILLYESNCDFLLYIRRGIRGGCKEWRWTAYGATDEGVLEGGWRLGDNGAVSLSLSDPEVAAAFLRLRRMFLERARAGPVFPDPSQGEGGSS